MEFEDYEDFSDSEEEVENIPKLNEEEFNNLVEEVEITRKRAIINRTKKLDFEVLNNILSEYLDSFIIIGYSSEGDEVVFNKMTTPRDFRSLSSLLEEVSMAGFVLDND